MAIEKYISTSWSVENVFNASDTNIKVANFTPETHTPDEITNFIQGLEPDDRYCYVHVIAMSDGDSYGPNLNGDIFRTAELLGMQSQNEADKNTGSMKGTPVQRFKTFEQSKFFRHHANSDADPFYGDVPLAAWNFPMRRVELIIRIFKQDIPELGGRGAPDIVAKLDRRGFITVSMGCRIHHETCRACGASNEFVKDRCPCLRDRMNEILSNGRQIAADNFGCRFFDISDVSIPADPIAFSIQKVAGLFSGANIARDFDSGSIIIPAWSAKLSAITKEIPAGCIGAIPVRRVPSHGMSNDSAKEIDADKLKVAFYFAKNLDEFVSTSALMGIVLSPRELGIVTGLAEPEKVGSVNFDFVGIRDLSLDNFSVSLYHSLSENVAERSGYLVACPSSGWQPTKIADAGFGKMADYYSFYRSLLDAIPIARFVKAAHMNPYVRELLGQDSDEQKARVESAMYHLAHAGMAV